MTQIDVGFKIYKLIIFDVDGTLRRCLAPGQVCPNAPDQWELMPNVKETLAEIKWGLPDCGNTAFGIASNQAGVYKDRKSTRLNSSHIPLSRMPSSA